MNFQIDKKDWFKIFIPHGTQIEFLYLDEEYYPNISNQNAPYFDLESGCMTLNRPKDNYIILIMRAFFYGVYKDTMFIVVKTYTS